jgi:hypothetical protein
VEAVRRHMPICCKSPNHIDASSTFHSISGIGTGGEPGGSLIPVYCGEIACCTRCWAPGLLFHRRYDPQFISRPRNERSPTPLRTPAGWRGVGYNLLDLDSTVHRTSQGTGQQGFSMPSSNPWLPTFVGEYSVISRTVVYGPVRTVVWRGSVTIPAISRLRGRTLVIVLINTPTYNCY